MRGVLVNRLFIQFVPQDGTGFMIILHCIFHKYNTK